MSNNLITTVYLEVQGKFNFKDPRLAEATKRISAIYDNAVKYADSKNREVASILSTVKNDQSYKADGFESVADYASKIFGLKRQNAYSLASAGDIYNSDIANDKLKALSPSKLAEVSTVPIERLNADVESGRIAETTTQKDLRKYKEEVSPKEEKKPVILDQFTARPISVCMQLPGEFIDLLSQRMTLPEWDEQISAYINSQGSSTCDVINLTKGKALVNGLLSDKRTVTRKLYITHDFSIAVEFYIVKTEPSQRPIQKDQLHHRAA